MAKFKKPWYEDSILTPTHLPEEQPLIYKIILICGNLFS